MTFIEKGNCMKRVDQLIRLKATGTPAELASRLGMSKRSVKNIIGDMRKMGASIYYCFRQRSYCYEGEVEFFFGYFDVDGKEIFGGKGTLTFGGRNFAFKIRNLR